MSYKVKKEIWQYNSWVTNSWSLAHWTEQNKVMVLYEFYEILVSIIIMRCQIWNRHWRPCLSKHLCHQTTSKNLNPYFVYTWAKFLWKAGIAGKNQFLWKAAITEKNLFFWKAGITERNQRQARIFLDGRCKKKTRLWQMLNQRQYWGHKGFEIPRHQCLTSEELRHFGSPS